MGDDPRPTEGDSRLRGTREPLQQASATDCYRLTSVVCVSLLATIDRCNQTINIRSLRHDKMQANDLKQKGKTDSKRKKAAVENKPEN